MLVPFAEWRPDAANLNSPYAADILNVLCADGGYIPFQTPVPLSGALPDVPLAGFAGRTSSGQIVIFAGTAGRLYRLNSTSLAWEDVSKAATTYSATSSERWQFAQFGPYLVAVNANDLPQVFEIGVSAAFADLAGNPPKARFVSVWGDFLALGGLTDHPARVHWSGLNDITKWTPGSDNSDYQDFPDGGPVMGMTDATNPIVFQQAAVRLGTFIPGSVEVFSFLKVHDKRGVVAPYSIASRGSVAFYADAGGFFQIGADGSLAPIGLEKVNRSIFGNITASDAVHIIGEIDPFHSRVYWNVKPGASDVLVVYDWDLQRWTQVGGGAQMLFPLAAATLGTTLEGLDAFSSSLDDLQISLDSKVWQGGTPIMGGFDSANRLVFFSGSNSEATLTTQEMGDPAGQVSRVSDIMPVVDCNAVKVSIGARMRRGDGFSWLPEAGQSTNTGMVRKKSRARFHKFKVRIPAGSAWTSAQGIDVKSAPAGLR